MIRVLPPSRHQLATFHSCLYLNAADGAQIICCQFKILSLCFSNVLVYFYCFKPFFLMSHKSWFEQTNYQSFCFLSAYNITLQDTFCTKAESLPPLASVFHNSMSAIQTTQLFSQQFVHVHHVKLYIPVKKIISSLCHISNVCHFKSLTCFRFYLTFVFLRFAIRYAGSSLSPITKDIYKIQSELLHFFQFIH